MVLAPQRNWVQGGRHRTTLAFNVYILFSASFRMGTKGCLNTRPQESFRSVQSERCKETFRSLRTPQPAVLGDPHETYAQNAWKRYNPLTQRQNGK